MDVNVLVNVKGLEKELQALMGEAQVEGFGDISAPPDLESESDEDVNPKAIKQPKVAVYQPGADVLELWNKKPVPVQLLVDKEQQYKQTEAKKQEERLFSYRTGTEHFLEGDFQKAIAHFKRVTSNGNVHYRDAINYLGQSYESVQSYQEALKCYKSITAKDSTNVNLRCRIAFLHTELGNFADASKVVAALDKIVGGKELEYDLDVRLLKVRVKCGIMQGKFPDALRELGKFFTRRFAVDFQFVYVGANLLYLLDEMSFALDCFLAFIIKCFLVLQIPVDERVMNTALAKCRFKNCSQSHWGTDYLIDKVDLTLATHYAVDILLGQDISNNSLAGSLLSILSSAVIPESVPGLDVRLMQAIISLRKKDDASASDALRNLNSIFTELDARSGITPSQISVLPKFFFTSSLGMRTAELLNANKSTIFSSLDNQGNLIEIADGDDFKFLMKQLIAAIKELKRFGRTSLSKRRVRHLIASLQQRMSFNKGLMSRIWCDISSTFDQNLESCEYICCIMKAVETSDLLEIIPVRMYTSFALSHGCCVAMALSMNAEHFMRLHNLFCNAEIGAFEDDISDDELWGGPKRGEEEVRGSLLWCKLLWQTGETYLYLTIACALLECAITQYHRGDAVATMTVSQCILGKMYRRTYINSTLLKPRIWLDDHRDKYRRILRLFGNQFHLKSYFMEDFLGIISLLREARESNETIANIYALHLELLVDEAEEAMNHKFRLQTMLTHNMLVGESDDITEHANALSRPPSHILNPAVKNAPIFKKRCLPPSQVSLHPPHIEQLINDPTNLGKANICARIFLHDLHENSDSIKFPRSFYKNNADALSVRLLQGHLFKKSGEHSDAINAYIEALRSSNEQPVTYLCLSTYALCAVQHRSFTGAKSDMLGKAIALLNLYKDRRKACEVHTIPARANTEEGGKEYCTRVALEQEIFYNFGRGFQEVNLFSLAYDCYVQSLAIADAHPILLNNGSINVTRETAHNMTLILKKSRRFDLAVEVAHKYLTI